MGAVLFTVLAIGVTILWIWALIDCLTKESSQGNDKLIWALVIIFLQLVGAIIYLLVRRPYRIETLGQ